MNVNSEGIKMKEVKKTVMGDCEWCRKSMKRAIFKIDEDLQEQFCSKACAFSYDGYGDQHRFFEPMVNYRSVETFNDYEDMS